jgi:hypothetical protein
MEECWHVDADVDVLGGKILHGRYWMDRVGGKTALLDRLARLVR